MDWEPDYIILAYTGLSMVFGNPTDGCCIAWNTNMDKTAEWTLSVSANGTDTVVFKKSK